MNQATTVPPPFRRVILVVLDGLRPDAIDAFDLANVRRLAGQGASTLTGRTVRPSLTWPALTSLMTGVSPDVHGVVADTVHLPRPRRRLEPLPELLAANGYPSSAFMAAVPALYRGVANRIARKLGFDEARFGGTGASGVLLAARTALKTQRRGLIFLHWPDADIAGHDEGWMSPAYAEAARRLDTSLGQLVSSADVLIDAGTLLVVLADHGGGGGSDPKHHEAEHPANRAIPIILSGRAVAVRHVGDAGLIDVPATVLDALGVIPPGSYEGRSLLADISREAAIA